MASSGAPQCALTDRMLTIAARRPARLHVRHGRLHQEERRARIDGKLPVPFVDRAGLQRGAIGEGGGVDQAVDAAEAVDRVGDDGGRRVRFAKIGVDEVSAAPGACKSSAHRSPRAALRPTIAIPATALAAASRAMVSPGPRVPPGDDKRLAFESDDQCILLVLLLAWLALGCRITPPSSGRSPTARCHRLAGAPPRR